MTSASAIFPNRMSLERFARKGSAFLILNNCVQERRKRRRKEENKKSRGGRRGSSKNQTTPNPIVALFRDCLFVWSFSFFCRVSLVDVIFCRFVTHARNLIITRAGEGRIGGGRQGTIAKLDSSELSVELGHRCLMTMHARNEKHGASEGRERDRKYRLENYEDS
jgi:hypothetical protein